MIKIRVVPGINCLCCGAPEVDPSRPLDEKLLPNMTLPADSLLRFSWWVRAFKVDSWSKCNWCGSWFDDQGTIDTTDRKPDWKPWSPA